MIPHCTTSLQNWTILHHSASFCISDISPFPLSFLFFYFVSSTFMGGADGPWATGLSLSLQRRGAQAPAAQLHSCPQSPSDSEDLRIHDELRWSKMIIFKISACFNMFQHLSTCFNTFQHVSTCFNMFQHVSTCFNMFQHVSTFVPVSSSAFGSLLRPSRLGNSWLDRLEYSRMRIEHDLN